MHPVHKNENAKVIIVCIRLGGHCFVHSLVEAILTTRSPHIYLLGKIYYLKKNKSTFKAIATEPIASILRAASMLKENSRYIDVVYENVRAPEMKLYA